MNIKVQPMGPYQTNCYIISIDGKDLIIDPGVDATQWVRDNVTNPLAILNTHGHFDHVWSNKEVSELMNLKIYTPKDDTFMLQKDPYDMGMTPSKADFEVQPDEEFEFEGIKVKFHHFPGHTPGCSAIQIGDSLFSGDFIFNGSIGRTDFPFSSPSDMKNSIRKVLAWKNDVTIYPGHGPKTSLKAENNSLKNWINYL